MISIFERENLSTIELPQGSEVVRDRQRPEPLRNEGYDESYDFHTIYYDAFVVDNGNTVRLVGPVLSNLASDVLAGRVVDISAGVQREALPFKIYQNLKVTYLDVDISRRKNTPSKLRFDFGKLGRFQVNVNPSEYSLFRGKRVVFTLFKYEPLEWLRDWIEFNVEYHGADAFLIYQNNSTEFNTEDVATVIADVRGVVSGAAINWSFPYGPDGSSGDHWESNFCQVGMMAHARWRFLSEARSVLNGDIDELIVTENHQSVFEIVEQSAQQHIEISGKWSGFGPENSNQSQKAAIRHRNMTHFVQAVGERPAQSKWAVVPRACPEDSRWITHNIGRMACDSLTYERAGLRHFRDLNTHWKLQRASSKEKAVEDSKLVEGYKKIGWA